MNKLSFLERKVFIFFANKQVEEFNLPIKELEEIFLANLEKDRIKYSTYLAQLHFKYNLNYNVALSYSKTVLQADPSNIDARLDLVQIICLKYIEHLDSCQGLIKECIQIDPNYWRIYYTQCVVFLYENRVDKSLYYLREYYVQFPNNTWIMIFLSQMLCDAIGEEDNSLRVLEEALKVGNYDCELLLRIAYIQSGLEQNEEAEIVIRTALALNPNSSKGYNNLGFYLRTVKLDYEESIVQCQKAVQLDENNDDGYFNLGANYHQLNNEKEALKYFLLCFKKNKNYIESLEQIIYLTYSSDKDTPKALYYANKYTQLFPQDYYGRYFFNHIQINEYAMDNQYLYDRESLSISQQDLLNSNMERLKRTDQYEEELNNLNHFYTEDN